MAYLGTCFVSLPSNQPGLIVRFTDKGWRTCDTQKHQFFLALLCDEGPPCPELTAKVRSGMISLIVPTYNEQENIRELVEQTGKALAASSNDDFELIIVDDNSPDGTADEVRSLQRSRPWLKLVVRENERDLSTAVLAGWRIARGEILGCMDGDLQHPPEHLLKLSDRLRTADADIVIASRYIEQGGVSDWKFHRRIVSAMATILAKLLLPNKARRVLDPMSGFFILKRSVIQTVILKPRGYKILLEVLGRGVYRWVEEVPYTFLERARGGSKIGLSQIWLYLAHLFRLSYETGEFWHVFKSIVIGLAVIGFNVTTISWLGNQGYAYLPLVALLAAELAWGTNFTLNELLTSRELGDNDGSLWHRFFRLHRLGFTAILSNGAVVYLTAGILGQSILLAGLSGAVLGLCLNAYSTARTIQISYDV